MQKDEQNLLQTKDPLRQRAEKVKERGPSRSKWRDMQQ